LANSKYQKIINSYALLEILYRGPTSRKSLAEELNLQPSTVFYTIDRLRELGLVKEKKSIGNDNFTPGRKSKNIYINPEAGLVFGVDLKINHYQLTIVRMDGSVYLQTENNFDTPEINEAVGTKERLIQCLNYIVKIVKQKCNGFTIRGGCISIPGLVDSTGLRIINSWSFGVKDFDASPYLENQGFPFYMENDANCCAFKYCKSKTDSFIYVLINKYSSQDLPLDIPIFGIGSGIVLNGKVWRGSTSKAGEFYSAYYHGNDPKRYLDTPNDILTNLDSNPEEQTQFLTELLSNLKTADTLINPDIIYLSGEIEKWSDNVNEILRNNDKSFWLTKNGSTTSFLKILNNTKHDTCEGAAILMLKFLYHIPYFSNASTSWEDIASPLLDGLD